MKYKTKPWDHQRQAINVAKNLNSFALFFDTGTGKTGAAINILRHWFARKKEVGKTLVVCPPIVITNWQRELDLHSWIRKDRILLLSGSGKKRVELLRQWSSKGSPFIAVTNYESLLMEPLFSELYKWGPDFFIWDESHKLKSPKSERSKRAVKLVRSRMSGINPVRPSSLLLSGTPILNDPLDLFQQFMVMDLGHTFGDNFYAFRGRYFWDIMSGSGRRFKIFKLRKGAEDEINAKIKPRVFRAKKEDCLDLPPLIRQTVGVPLAPCQRKMYNDLKNEFVATMSKDIVAADLAIVQGLRLLQMVSGFYVTIDGKTKDFKVNPKEEALTELLESWTPNSKVIVWASFKQNYEQIRRVCKKLNITYVEVHGGISAKNKVANIDIFNNDPVVRVLIGNHISGGVGCNLAASDCSIFFSRNFSLEGDLQARGRNYRGGSNIHKKVTHIDLVMENTIDSEVQKRLEAKVKISNEVLKDIGVKLAKD